MVQTIRYKKLSRRPLTNIYNPRIANGLTKKYRKYSLKQNGAGLFSFIRLKWKMRVVNKIIGKLNTLEKNMNKEIDSYETKAKRFENLAKEKAEFQTKYIVAFREKIVYDIYRSDKEELDKQNVERKTFIDTKIKRLNILVENSKIGAVEKDRIFAAYLKEYLRLFKKFSKELEDFNKIAAMKNKIEAFQNEIKDLRDAAQSLDGKTKLSKEDKAKAKEYKANEGDYKRILSLSNDNLEAINKIQEKSADIITTARYYKDQFGIYRIEDKSIGQSKTKGKLDQDFAKAEDKLEKWTKAEIIFANNLMLVNAGIKDIITQTENLQKWLDICVKNLVTVWINWQEKPESQAILWFQNDIDTTMKAFKKIKTYFLEMKADFYKMVPAKNMYVNYNRNVRYLNFIERKLKEYIYLVGKAIVNYEKEQKTNSEKTTSGGGWFNMFGGAVHPAQKQKPKSLNSCQYLKDDITNTKFYSETQIQHIITHTNNIENFRKRDDCYNKPDTEFKKCLTNLINIYLVVAFLHDNLTVQPDLDNSQYKTSIEALFQIDKIVNASALPWDNNTKKIIQKKFEQVKKIDLSATPPYISHNDVKSKKISELFTSAGAILGLGQNITLFTNFVSGKTYLIEFIKAAINDLNNNPTNNFYNIINFDVTKSSLLKNFTDNITNTYDYKTDPVLTSILQQAQPAVAAAATATATGTTQQQQTAQKSSVLITNPHEFPAKIEELKDLVSGGHNFAIHYNYPLIIDEMDNIYKTMRSLMDKNPDVDIPNINEYNKILNDILTNKYRGLYDDQMLDMKQKLQQFKNFSVKPLELFYDRVLSYTEDKQKAKDAMTELANLLKKNNDNPSATMVDILAANPKFNPVHMPDATKVINAPSVINVAAAQQNAGLTSSTPLTLSSSTNTPKKETEEEKKKREELEKMSGWPEHWLETARIKKLNPNVITDILLRIPKDLEVQRETVYTHFIKMKSALEKLSDKNIIHKLSNLLLQMTDQLIEIKSIESDIIDIKVANYTPPTLGLGSWILDPINSELKSGATAVGDEIDGLIKEIQTNKLYTTQESKEDKESVQKLYDKLLGQCHSGPIKITLEEKKLLTTPENLYSLLSKITEYSRSTGAIASADSKDKRILSMKKLLCNMIKSFELVADSKEQQDKINEVQNNIHPGCYIKEEKSDKKKDK
jgi:hypothetical protein